MERWYLVAMALLFVSWDITRCFHCFESSNTVMKSEDSRSSSPDSTQGHSTGISPLYRSTVLYNRIEATMQYDNATNMFESKVLRELRSPHQMMQEMTMRQRLLTWSRVMLLAQPGASPLLWRALPRSWLMNQRVQEDLMLFHSGSPVLEDQALVQGRTTADDMVVTCSATVDTVTLQLDESLLCTVTQTPPEAPVGLSVLTDTNATDVWQQFMVTRDIAKLSATHNRFLLGILRRIASKAAAVVGWGMYPCRIGNLGPVTAYLSVLYQDSPVLVSLVCLKVVLHVLVIAIDQLGSLHKLLIPDIGESDGLVFLRCLMSGPIFLVMTGAACLWQTMSYLEDVCIGIILEFIVLLIPGMHTPGCLSIIHKMVHLWLMVSCIILALGLMMKSQTPRRRRNPLDVWQFGLPTNMDDVLPFCEMRGWWWSMVYKITYPVVVREGELTQPRCNWPELEIPDSIKNLPVEDIPEEFLCPITHCIMRQPARLGYSGTYEADNIRRWLHKYRTDPQTKEEVQMHTLTFDITLARRIDHWVTQKAEELSKADTGCNSCAYVKKVVAALGQWQVAPGHNTLKWLISHFTFVKKCKGA